MEGNLFEKIYRVDHRKVPWGYKNPDPDLVYIIEWLRLPSNTRVLDMGCGNGKNTTYLETKKFKLCGFDISEKAISVAKKRVPSGKFIVADVVHLPYADKYFDAVIDWGLFHCILPEKRHCAIKEILRVLKPRGTYLMRAFDYPNSYSAKTPLFYENTDQTGRTKKRDLSREQFPVWGFSFRQIDHIFSRSCIIKNKFSCRKWIIVVMLKK